MSAGHQTGSTLADVVQVAVGLASTVPSSSTPKYISLKDADVAEVKITVINTTGVTGSAITLNQATAVAGTGTKALAFTVYYQCLDANANCVLTKQTAVSNTFTTLTTSSKVAVYRIPVRGAMLDSENSFDCLNCGTANAVNATVTVEYLIRSKIADNAVLAPNVMVD